MKLPSFKILAFSAASFLLFNESCSSGSSEGVKSKFPGIPEGVFDKHELPAAFKLDQKKYTWEGLKNYNDLYTEENSLTVSIENTPLNATQVSGVNVNNLLKNSKAEIFLLPYIDKDGNASYHAIPRSSLRSAVASAEKSANRFGKKAQVYLWRPEAEEDKFNVENSFDAGDPESMISVLLTPEFLRCVTAEDIERFVIPHEVAHSVWEDRTHTLNVRKTSEDSINLEASVDTVSSAVYRDYASQIRGSIRLMQLGIRGNKSGCVNLKAIVTAFANDTSLSLEERTAQVSRIKEYNKVLKSVEGTNLDLGSVDIHLSHK